jgi:hypothetical protein
LYLKVGISLVVLTFHLSMHVNILGNPEVDIVKIWVVFDQMVLWEGKDILEGLSLVYAVAYTFHQNYFAPNTLEFIQR